MRFGSLPASVVGHMPGGVEIEVDARDAMGKAIYLYGCYEYAVTELIQTLVGPDTVFFDVGANIGYYTLLAAPISKRVFAFEPVGKIYEQVNRNILRNRLANVKTFNCAVGDHDGEAALFLPQSSENIGLASLEAMDNAERVIVPLVTLDRVVRDHAINRVDLIKIDVERAEVQAFEGGRELLSRSDAPDVIFESHQGSGAAEWLRQHGFQNYSFRHQREYEAPNLFATKRPLPGNIAPKLQAYV